MYSLHRYEPTRTYRRHKCRVELSPARGAARWYALTMLLIGLAAALGFVYLRSERQKMERELQQMRRDLALRSKEMANLRMELEGLKSGGYVLTVVERLGLGLHRPLPGQVRRVPTTQPERCPEWLAKSMVARK